MVKKTFKLDGEVNAKTGEEQKNNILDVVDEADMFILSFTDVVYLNSSGLREIIDLFKQLKSKNKQLRLYGMSEDVREMFSFTGLDKIFSIYDSLDDAME